MEGWQLSMPWLEREFAVRSALRGCVLADGLGGTAYGLFCMCSIGKTFVSSLSMSAVDLSS